MKKIQKDMFLWSKTSVAKGLDVHFQKQDNPVSRIIVLVPKRVVGLAVERNSLRRRVKEMFRKNVSRSHGGNFLVKFNSVPTSFDMELEKYFKNV
jgi:ribonuclease P protein component